MKTAVVCPHHVKEVIDAFVPCVVDVSYEIPFSCGRCYIGQTERCINVRLRQQQRDLERSKDKQGDFYAASSSFVMHCLKCGCQPEFEKTKVIAAGKEHKSDGLLRAIEEAGERCVSYRPLDRPLDRPLEGVTAPPHRQPESSSNSNETPFTDSARKDAAVSARVWITESTSKPVLEVIRKPVVATHSEMSSTPQIAGEKRKKELVDHEYEEKRMRHELQLKQKEWAIEERRLSLEENRLAWKKERFRAELQLKKMEMERRARERAEGRMLPEERKKAQEGEPSLQSLFLKFLENALAKK